MYLRIKVIPRAKKAEVIQLEKNQLKIKLMSPPINNKANRELIALLAEYYGVKKVQLEFSGVRKTETNT